MSSTDNGYPKEIEFAIREDQFQLLTEAIADAIQAQYVFGNRTKAVELANLQKVVMLQKMGQDYLLKQAKQILKVK